jgi:hypothetical protein
MFDDAADAALFYISYFDLGEINTFKIGNTRTVDTIHRTQIIKEPHPPIETPKI